MKRFGFLDQAKAELEKAGMEVSIVDNVEPNPSIETVIRGGKEMAEFGITHGLANAILLLIS